MTFGSFSEAPVERSTELPGEFKKVLVAFDSSSSADV
jgi:hypothetical protein